MRNVADTAPKSSSYVQFPAESIRYLDTHPVLPDDAPPELKDSYEALLAPLLLNSALSALRAGGTANAAIAIKATDRALENMELNDADKGVFEACLIVFLLKQCAVYS